MTSSADGSDARLRAPSTARNAEPIFDVLKDQLPSRGTVLEIASGAGEHGALYAPRLPSLKWQPSDRDAASLASINAWREHSDVTNLLPPVEIDLLAFEARGNPVFDDITAMVNINMIHISPWAACENLLSLAQSLLPSGAPLCLYGPYRREGDHTAPSNAEFDTWLKEQNSSWGVRNIEDITATASSRNLVLRDVIEMPANNLIVVFERQ